MSSLTIRRLGCLFLLGLPFSASATWSIVVRDADTQEVAVASATCVSREDEPGIDLVPELPVIRVGVGAASAQSAVDTTGGRRVAIWNGLINGQSATQIVSALSARSDAASAQHGVVGSGTTSGTQTGSGTFAHASGVTGRVGTLDYAIQGNILTNRNVVLSAEQALRNTSGQLPERLMAAMEAARAQGGDARCSCKTYVNGIGCTELKPVPFKTADVGFMILARYGDIDDSACTARGCADGTYYMKLNIRDQPRAAIDAVYQLQTSLTSARTALNGIADAVASQARFDPLANGAYRIVITPRDWRGQAIARSLGPVQIVTSGSNGFSIGTVQTVGDGTYQATLTPTGATPPTRNAFLVSIQDGTLRVWLPPNRTVLTLGATGNRAPVANFNSSTSGLTVTFTDTSTDTDGSIASRAWNFGDGTTSTSANPSKTYATAGTYTVSLTVTDNGGLTNTKTQSLTVGTNQTKTYTNGTDFNITDNATVESPIAVSGRTGNAPAATSVAVNIIHTYIGDLKVDLIAPDGSVYVLHNRSGGSADNIVNTYSVNLSNESLNGSWKLRVNDNANGDVGRIDSWSITF